MEENTLLEVKDLRVVYKTDEATVHAVNGISFTLGERETIGLVWARRAQARPPQP